MPLPTCHPLARRWLAAAALGLAASLPAQALVIGFDDLSLPPEWGGLGWAPYHYLGDYYWGEPGWAIVTDSYLAGFDNGFTAPSGNQQVFNGNTAENGGGTQQTLTLSSLGGDFNFQGAYVAGWGQNGQAQAYTAGQVTATGLNGGVVVGSVTIDLSASQYTWLAADLQGLDELRISANGPNLYFLLDNLTISPVPEPASFALLGLGLLGVGWAVRQRQAATRQA